MSGRLDDDGVQFAAGSSRGVDFPAEWGSPPGSRMSEERAAWVADHVRRHIGDPVRRLQKVNRIRLADLRKAMVDLRMQQGEELEALLRAEGHLSD